MPILRAEAGWYPSDSFDCADGLRANGRSWSISHIRSRQEKALARELRRAEIPHFLPLFQRRRYNRGRLLTSSSLQQGASVLLDDFVLTNAG